MARASARDMLARMSRNLRRCYTSLECWDQALRAADRCVDLVPSPAERRDRGLLLWRMGKVVAALTDITAYLDEAPENCPDRTADDRGRRPAARVSELTPRRARALDQCTPMRRTSSQTRPMNASTANGTITKTTNEKTMPLVGHQFRMARADPDVVRVPEDTADEKSQQQEEDPGEAGDDADRVRREREPPRGAAGERQQPAGDVAQQDRDRPRLGRIGRPRRERAALLVVATPGREFEGTRRV